MKISLGHLNRVADAIRLAGLTEPVTPFDVPIAEPWEALAPTAKCYYQRLARAALEELQLLSKYDDLTELI